jgi:AcrR family transcriptional regulator
VTVEQLNVGGEAEIRLETILAEADCSPSSLYHHFGNLRGLLDEAQIVRFSEVLAGRTAKFVAGVEDIKSREKLIEFCGAVIDDVMASPGGLARSQRVNALGSTYKRPDFAKRMAQAQIESCEALAAALRVPQLRGLIDESIDLYSLAHWIQGLLFSRVLIELTNDDTLGTRWTVLTKRAILSALFDPGDAADRP